MRAAVALLLIAMGCTPTPGVHAPTNGPPACTPPTPKRSGAKAAAFMGGMIAVGGAVMIATADGGNESDSDIDEAITRLAGLGVMALGGVVLLVGSASAGQGPPPNPCLPRPSPW